MFERLDFSCSGMILLFEQWAGHRLLSEKAVRPRRRSDRPISFASPNEVKELKFAKAVNDWEVCCALSMNFFKD